MCLYSHDLQSFWPTDPWLPLRLPLFQYRFLYVCSSPVILTSLCFPISESLDLPEASSSNTLILNIHKACPLTSSTSLLKRHISERTSLINLSKIPSPSLSSLTLFYFFIGSYYIIYLFHFLPYLQEYMVHGV